MKKSERGGAAIWFLLLILGIGIWVGFRVGQAYFDHASLEKEMKTLALNVMTSGRHSGLSDQIQAALNRFHAAYDPEAISIRTSYEGTRMIIHVPYARELDFGVTRMRLSFEVDVEQDAPYQGGLLKDMRESVEQSYERGTRRSQE